MENVNGKGNTTLMVGGIIVIIAIIAGIVYAVQYSRKAAENLPVPISNVNDKPVEEVKSSSPIVTTNATVTPSSVTSIVNGEINPNGALTTYWYEYGLSSGNLSSKTANQVIGSGFALISAPGYITGLTKNTNYHFRLVGENRHGKVIGNVHTFKTTTESNSIVVSYPVVKTLEVTGLSRTTARLRGEITSNNVATRYWFEYGKTNQFGQVSAFSSAEESDVKATVSILLDQLDPMTTYYFRVNAQNKFGTVNGETLSFTTQGPISVQPPTVMTNNATAVTTTSATLNGTVNPNSSQTTYWFEYSANSLLGTLVRQSTEHISIDNGSGTLSIDASITNLSPRTTYYFRIVAQNEKGIERGEQFIFKTK